MILMTSIVTKPKHESNIISTVTEKDLKKYLFLKKYFFKSLLKGFY